MRKRNFVVLFAVILSLALVGCAADTKERTGEYIDDAGITTRVKAKLSTTRRPAALPSPSRPTRERCSSRASSAVKRKSRAEELAKTVPSVKSVKNDLIVKSK